MDFFASLYSICSRHLNVHEHYVGCKSAALLDSGFSIRQIGGNSEPIPLIDKLDQPFTIKRLIIDRYDFNLIAHAPFRFPP